MSEPQDDSETTTPDNVSKEPVPLTPREIAVLRARIEDKIDLLKIGRRKVSKFQTATEWVLKVFAYTVSGTSGFAPSADHGATFEDFCAFVTRRERDAEAEEIDEGR